MKKLFKISLIKTQTLLERQFSEETVEVTKGPDPTFPRSKKYLNSPHAHSWLHLCKQKHHVQHCPVKQAFRAAAK